MLDVSAAVRVRVGAEFVSLQGTVSVGELVAVIQAGLARKWRFRMTFDRSGSVGLVLGPAFLALTARRAVAVPLVNKEQSYPPRRRG